MKTILFIILAIVAIISCSLSSALAKLEMHSMTNEHGYLKVIVLYTNNTENTYMAVRIKCTALDSNGRFINCNKRSFYDQEYEPIKPLI